jgi:hypothetical protein
MVWGVTPAQRRRGQSHVDAAFLGVAGPLMECAPADMVAVLGQVDQVAEVGEGPDHADGLVAAERHQQLFERTVGVLVGMASKGNRQGADALDQFESGFAVLVADHIAQDPAEQAYVLGQGTLVFALCAAGLILCGGWCWRWRSWLRCLLHPVAGPAHASIGRSLKITNWLRL